MDDPLNNMTKRNEFMRKSLWQFWHKNINFMTKSFEKNRHSLDKIYSFYWILGFETTLLEK